MKKQWRVSPLFLFNFKGLFQKCHNSLSILPYHDLFVNGVVNIIPPLCKVGSRVSVHRKGIPRPTGVTLFGRGIYHVKGPSSRRVRNSIPQSGKNSAKRVTFAGFVVPIRTRILFYSESASVSGFSVSARPVPWLSPCRSWARSWRIRSRARSLAAFRFFACSTA